MLAWRWLADHGPNDEAALARAANRMLRRLLRVMRMASTRDFLGPAPWPGLRDEDDVPIWATAVVAGAQYVISHDIGDFPPLVAGRHVYHGIEYLTTLEFVEDVLGDNAQQVHDAPLPRDAAVRSGRVAAGR